MNPLSQDALDDPRRVEPLNPGELPYWSKALDVSEYDVLCAVDKVGMSAAEVRRWLAEHSPLQH